MAAGYPVSSALILFILSIASKIGAPPSVFHDPKATCVGNVHVDLICPDRNLCPMKTTLGEVRSKGCWFVSSSQSTHRRFATVCHQRAMSVSIWSRIRKAVFRSHFYYQPAEKLHSRFAVWPKLALSLAKNTRLQRAKYLPTQTDHLFHGAYIGVL